MEYQALVKNAVSLLREAIASRYEAGPHARKVQAQAYADGYMRALVDAQFVDEQQLLELITAERARELDARDAAAPLSAVS